MDPDEAVCFKPRKLNVSQWAYSLSHRFRLFRLLDAYVLRGFWFFFRDRARRLRFALHRGDAVRTASGHPENKVTPAPSFVYFLFLMPQIFFWVTPLTVLLAILINLGTLTKTNEILAVKAGAISLYRMSLPLILMAGVLSGIVYVMQDYVLPCTNQRQDEYHDIIKGRAPQTYRDPYRKWMMGSGNRIYHYTFFDPDLRRSRDLSIFELDPDNVSAAGMALCKARHLEWHHLDS